MISINYLIVSFSNYGYAMKKHSVSLDLTEPQKLADRVRVSPHLYCLSWQCGIWTFTNTPPHA